MQRLTGLRTVVRCRCSCGAVNGDGCVLVLPRRSSRFLRWLRPLTSSADDASRPGVVLGNSERARGRVEFGREDTGGREQWVVLK
jgi:hypothetical protein